MFAVLLFHHNMDFSGKQMPFYFFLTTFRVLSISLAIVSLPYTIIFLYPLFILGIVILGYLKASKEEGFLVRGMRSLVTTVDERYHAEKVFQIYWLVANAVLLVVG